MTRLLLASALLLGLAADVLAQDAQGRFGRVIRIDIDAFSPDAGKITFSEKRRGTRNPRYGPGDYGAKAGAPRVSFAGWFVGQSRGSRSQCPRGANPSGCVVGEPSAPLRLAQRAPETFVAADGANPRSPSLSGTPVFNGPVSMLFDRDVAGIGLAGGFFNAPRSTAIRAFDRDGKLLGGVVNLSLGMEFMALVTEDGADRIAGLQFSLVGPEPAGYGIDDLTFALAGQLQRDRIEGLAPLLGAPSAGPAPQPPGSLSDLIGRRDEGRPAPDDGKSLSDLLE